MSAFKKCLLLLSIVVTVRCFDYDNDVCNSTTFSKPDKPGPKKPTFKQSFRATIEAKFLNKNLSLDFTEFFDNENNRGVLIEEEPPNHKERAIYSEKTDELIIIYEHENPKRCQVLPLDSSKDNFLFGYSKGGKDHLFTTNGALRFNTPDSNEVFFGTKWIRGIIVDQWVGCIKWDDWNATMRVVWSFSSQDWTTALDEKAIPVRIELVGSVIEGNKKREIHHIYDIIKWRSPIPQSEFLEQSIFETPRGTICPGKVSKKQMPVPTKGFQYKAEVVRPNLNAVQEIYEAYDESNGLVRRDYQRLPFLDSEYGYGKLKQVDDFNHDIRYTIDKTQGNCTAKPLLGVDYDSEIINGSLVLRSPQHFFDFSGKSTYVGKRIIRGGLPVDVWIAHREDFPFSSPVNSTFEWYFADPSWLEYSGRTEEKGELVRIYIANHLGPLDIVTEYNIYDYSETTPDIWKFDISECFEKHQQKHFQFRLKYNEWSIVSQNDELTKYAVILSVSGLVAISPLRVTHIEIELAEDVVITFTMLDVAPFTNNKTVPEVPLAVAAEMLKEYTAKSKFFVQFPVNKKLVGLKAYNFEEVERDNNGRVIIKDVNADKTVYSPGSLAGTGVALSIVGILGGAAAGIFFFR